VAFNSVNIYSIIATVLDFEKLAHFMCATSEVFGHRIN